MEVGLTEAAFGPVGKDSLAKEVKKDADIMGKDIFLKLLVAQLKYQDPINPMEGTEFTTQLAQFSSLDRLNDINSSLATLNDSQELQTKSNVLNMIGKKVVATGNDFYADEMGGEVNFDLAANASEVKITIRDEDGLKLREMIVRDLAQGRQKEVWDGLSWQMERMPVGIYSFDIMAVDAQGEDVAVDTLKEGVVSGITFRGELPYLSVGNTEIALTDVQEIVN